MCDIRIASDRAKFAGSFAKVGIVPGDGGAWLLARAIGLALASEMAFKGDTIDAQQAQAGPSTAEPTQFGRDVLTRSRSDTIKRLDE